MDSGRWSHQTLAGFSGGNWKAKHWTKLCPLPTTSSDRLIVVNESHQGAVPMQITTIGLDIAKNVFQVHGIDAAEKVIVRGARQV